MYAFGTAVKGSFRRRRFVTQLIVLIFLFGIPESPECKVSGPCGDCHTMHSSQGDTTAIPDNWDLTEARESLLVNSCLGCHTGVNTGTNTIPYVMATSEPVFGSGTLAGGNFWWVKNIAGPDGDAKGHNIFLDETDANLDKAPGSTILSCGVADSCHDNLSEPYVDGQDPDLARLNGKYGCEGCHLAPAHHADDTVEPVINSTEEGWYRFLSGHESGAAKGVAGIEDDDWQYTKSAADHNEYLGDSTYDKAQPGNMARLGNTMTGFCVGCHGNFHVQAEDNSWIRHPSDAVIPNRTEYADAFGAGGSGTGTYDPNVPVARETLTAVSSDVTIGSDMVMCLSCHVPHGSPYDDLLRWDYSTMQAGSGSNTNGCFACHTTKDGA